MSKETALQIAMRITHRYANSLFDEHTARGRQYMQEMSECLEQEREQMLKLISFVRMHNKMGKSADDLLQEFETYKGGKQ